MRGLGHSAGLMLIRRKRAALAVLLLLVVVLAVFLTWPNKWDRLEHWVKEKDEVYKRRQLLSEALTQIKWPGLPKEDEKDSCEIFTSDDKLMNKLLPIPEVPEWVKELAAEHEIKKNSR